MKRKKANKMKLYKYFIIIAALLLITEQSKAQQTIDPTLEVKRDFDAKLLEITKGKLHTNFDDSLGRFNLSFDYSIFDKPIQNLYEFSPLPSAQIEKSVGSIQPILFLKAGANIPLNPYGSIYIQPRLPKSFSLVIGASHNSFISKLPAYYLLDNSVEKASAQVAAPSSKSDLGIDFKYHWNKGVVGLKAGYSNRMNSYYGFNQQTLSPSQEIAIFKRSFSQNFMRDSMSHSTNTTRAGFYAKSLNSNPNSFYYDASFSYSKLFNNESHPYYVITMDPFLPIPPPLWEDRALSNNKLDEQYINLSLTAGAGFADFNKILAGVKYEASDSRFSDSLDRSNLELHPRYIFKKGRWDFDLGFKYNMWWDRGSNDFNIYFSSSATLEVITNKLWVYGFIDGKNNFMNYHKMLELNPWISPAIDIQNVEQPVIARAGIKGSIIEKLSFNLYGGYYEYRNQIYFLSNNSNYMSEDISLNSFDAIYRDEKRTGLGAELSFKSNSFEGAIIADVYSFRDQNNMTNNHYNYSPFELKMMGRYSWRERIIVSGAFKYKQKSPGLLDLNLVDSGVHPNIFIPSSAVLDLNVAYAYNKNLTFFIQLNNILDSKVFEYTNYAMPGFNGGAGLSFKL